MKSTFIMNLQTIPFPVPGGVDVVILLFARFPGAKNHSSPIFRMKNEIRAGQMTCSFFNQSYIAYTAFRRSRNSFLR